MSTITTQTLQRYGIDFSTGTFGKEVANENKLLAGFINTWACMADLNDIVDFIADINRCMNGSYDYDLEDVTSYSIHNYQAQLTSTGIVFHNLSDTNYNLDSWTFPYQDLQILLTALKEYMQSQ